MGFVVIIDSSKCTACRMCEVACSLRNSEECNPERSRIRAIIKENDGRINVVPSTCMQCETAMCMHVCPNNAIQRNSETGSLAIDDRKCIGCSACSYACPFGACYVDRIWRRAVTCDQCGGDPSCVKVCPTGALEYVSEDRVNIKRKRIGAEHLVGLTRRFGVEVLQGIASKR